MKIFDWLRNKWLRHCELRERRRHPPEIVVVERELIEAFYREAKAARG